jgi:hypothetical protein
MPGKDVTETIDSMTPVVDKWRAKYGEEIARELIRAYLTGVDDALQNVMALGAGSQHVLYERLKGN